MIFHSRKNTGYQSTENGEVVQIFTPWLIHVRAHNLCLQRRKTAETSVPVLILSKAYDDNGEASEIFLIYGLLGNSETSVIGPKSTAEEGKRGRGGKKHVSWARQKLLYLHLGCRQTWPRFEQQRRGRMIASPLGVIHLCGSCQTLHQKASVLPLPRPGLSWGGGWLIHSPGW